METYLGGYRILGEIGRGSMGTVYKAERSGEVVALKVLGGAWAGDPAMAGRFVEESQVMRRLSHPAIVRVLDVGWERGNVFMAQEYVEGPPLARAIERKAFTHKETAFLLSAVGRALQHAHRMGVIHGDVAPSNILLKGDGSPKLTDFGIARLRQISPERWKSGVTAGTPIYMSPEQAAALSDMIDVRSDVYSLGVVLYHAVTGRVPFVGRSAAEILEKVIRVAPPAPRAAEPSVDPALERIILKAMDKDPARRYSGAKDFADALQAWARAAQDWTSVLPS
jgi:serine/threonine-protein kinase